jgi:hypothetical protein
MAMQVTNEDQYTPAVYYGAGSYSLTRRMIGTRYAIATVRVLVDFSNKEDVRQVHALQDAIKFNQERAGAFEVPNWDQPSLKKVQAALLQLGTTVSDTRRMFGASEDQVDPVKHLIGSAMLWGGNPEKDGLYLPITPARNDGSKADASRTDCCGGSGNANQPGSPKLTGGAVGPRVAFSSESPERSAGASRSPAWPI